MNINRDNDCYSGRAEPLASILGASLRSEMFLTTSRPIREDRLTCNLMLDADTVDHTAAALGPFRAVMRLSPFACRLFVAQCKSVIGMRDCGSGGAIRALLNNSWRRFK